ncbi:MAG TPA: transposase [Candidatus Saccharimonadales bacterium]|nr:transposase [Candidatus Saccharimonadales bacterium]
MKRQYNYGRQYDAHFKEQAVQLLLSSGKSINRVSKELGISFKALQQWKDAHLRKNEAVEHHGRRITAEQLYLQNQRLQRELERVTTQRDILKKSLGILSEPQPPQKDMPK